MREELQRWLDGELPEDALPPDLRDEAVRLRALFDTPREVGPAPDWIEHRVMRALPERRPAAWRRAMAWLARPREIRVRPVTVGAMAVAVIAVVLAWPGVPAPSPGAIAGDSAVQAGGRADDGRVYVQFVYVAPDAETVAVAGDFNEWADSGYSLRDPDGDGVWTGQLPLAPGLHKYMFVVDGQWVTDPRAERYVDDGFGNRNALISVGYPGSSI
jgi:hypothetical protein